MLSLKNFALVGLLGSLATVSHADLMSEFSITNGNPNGAWSYGQLTTLGGSFMAADVAGTGMAGGATLDSWSFSTTTFPVISELISGSLIGYNGGDGLISIGEVTMHPGPSNELAAIRYTAASAGLFDLSGYFGAGDGLGGGQYGKVDVYVYKNSTQLWSVSNTASTQAFSLPAVSLAAGDKIDLVVGFGADGYIYDSTPVNLSVTPVPEPATIAGLGLALAAFAKRRRK